MASALYSSTAPAGWNQLDPATKQKFYDIASKGDWTAHEAYDHLVPDHLKDNPDEVVAWMDGDVDVGVPDRDVSRIQSGENGGEYSTDNTIMEHASSNRARGGTDMTDSEYAAVVEDNAADAEIIETYFDGAAETAEVVADSSSLLTDALSTAGELVLPVALACKAGMMAHKFQNNNSDTLTTSPVAPLPLVPLATGIGFWLGTTTVGAFLASGWAIYAASNMVYKAITAD